MAQDKPQTTYSHSGSKELLQKVLNDPKYVIRRWNAAKRVYDEVYPYQVFRTLLKKLAAEMKYPNKTEINSIDDMNIRIFDELVELLPELVAVHLDNDMKFRLPTEPESNGVIYRKFVPAGSKVSPVRNIQTNTVDGSVKSVWTDHYVIKCSSKRPHDCVTKTRLPK